MKPFVGVTCNYDSDDEVAKCSGHGVAGQAFDSLAADYTDALEKAGAIPVVIPQCASFSCAVELLGRLDGLLVTGGNDVDPQLYGKRLKSYSGKIEPRRDAQDIALLRAAREKSLPTLGICRGFQLMAVAFGGDLYQDLEREAGKEAHFLTTLPRNAVSHQVVLEKGSRLRKIFGVEQMGVNSLHHQGVCRLPDEGVRTALSEDGVTEAIEFSGGHPFFIGVQWHPEMMYDSDQQGRLFQAFVDACRT
ncbi:MAG: gamma-glutamyl-gamma-aminobutyrate hydrolase family protein [Oscillospiraceae bacterium]|nr:gamma-glutamyl-gamma-aminobutyrate hydrolase family protein [Oscillospiraceae bacterium]